MGKIFFLIAYNKQILNFYFSSHLLSLQLAQNQPADIPKEFSILYFLE